MNQHDLEAFIAALDNVQRDDSYGYTMYFVGDDHRVPFVSLAAADNEYDRVSNLDRDGVYRVNIGVTRKTFAALFGAAPTDDIDYTALNVFMPHPHYARQNFICILNPAGEHEALTKQYIREAHDFAARRVQRGQTDT
jgi:hypothetical protein